MAEHFDEDASQSIEESKQSPNFGQLICRFKYLVIFFAVYILQACLINSQLPFIKTTWFARQHVEKSEHVDCNDTPKLHACQQGAADLAYWTGLLSGIAGITAIFSSIALGSLSDAIGRCKVIIAGVVLSICVKFTLLAVVVFDVPLWVFLFVETLNEGFDTTGVFLAMVADLTQDQRAQRGPIFGLSVVFVVIVACVFTPLSALLSYKTATTLAVVLSIVSLVLACFLVPETNITAAGKEGHQGFSALRGELHDAMLILNRNSFMQRMVAILALGGVAFAAKSTIMRPYMMAHFGLDKKDFAILPAICAPSIVIFFTIGLWKGVSCFGEVAMLQGSFFANALMTLGIIVAAQSWQVFVTYGILIGPGLMFIPLINSIKSNLVSDHEQGKVQGIIAAVRGLAASIADVAFGALYRWMTDDGNETEAAKPCLFLVLGLTLAAASLTLTLPASYPKAPTQNFSSLPAIELGIKT